MSCKLKHINEVGAKAVIVDALTCRSLYNKEISHIFDDYERSEWGLHRNIIAAIERITVNDLNDALKETRDYGATQLRTDIVNHYKQIYPDRESKVIDNPSSIVGNVVKGTGSVLSSVVGSASSLVSGLGRVLTGSKGGKKSRKYKKKSRKTNRRRNKTKAR